MVVQYKEVESALKGVANELQSRPCITEHKVVSPLCSGKLPLLLGVAVGVLLRGCCTVCYTLWSVSLRIIVECMCFGILGKSYIFYCSELCLK